MAAGSKRADSILIPTQCDILQIIAIKKDAPQCCMNENTKRSIRESYDRVAEAYAHHYYRELEHKPVDRELLNRFAGKVAQVGDVCDLGCGPGHIARYLRDAGTTVFGMDLSPQMIAQARRLNPEIPFREGDMTALDIPDATLGGIVAFYGIVNIPRESLPIVFREMERVLQPGGTLLLSFHIGDEIVRPESLLGQPVAMDFFFFRPSSIRQYM